MGMMENGTQEPESTMIEKSKTLENLSPNPNCRPPTSENYKLESERLVNVTVEQKEVTRVQIIEKKSISVEESSERINEMGPNPGDKSQNLGEEKREPLLEDVKIPLAVEKFEAGSDVVLGNGKLEPMQIDAATDPGHLQNEDKGTPVEARKIAKGKTPVSSSWSLRSRSQEKPKVPDPVDVVKEGDADEQKKRSRKKKKQMKKNTGDEFSRKRSHLRYLLHRIKYEQSLIDAYSAEGWKRQSVDKLKPEKELERAKSHILQYKLKIRALFQHLDTSLSTGKLPATLFDSEGEIDSEDIFCAKCGSKDVLLDNDIILCDGACERGFHQFCLEPPLLKEQIPPGDEGWLCPGCDCKVDCIDILKDFQGSKISILDSWEKIFPEAASGKKLDDGSGSSSDDSEDDDFNPDKPDTVEKAEGNESSSDESNYVSADDDLAPSVDNNNNEKYLGLPSDDSEDDDFDPSAPNQEDEDKEVKEDGSSSDFTSDSEDLGALLKDADLTGEDPEHNSPSTVVKEEKSKVGRKKGQSLKDEISYLMETSPEPVSGKRHVERLDYKKLLEETYGDDSSSDSSDEDFGDTAAPKRRKINRDKTEVISSPDITPITQSKTDMENENPKENKSLTKRTRKRVADEASGESSAKGGSSSTGTKRSANKRLAEATTQRLYESFNVNQYPEKAVKESLAKELGLEIRQITKWFENARWSFNHRPQMESKSTQTPPEPQPTVATDNAVSTQIHTSGTGVANLVTNASGENSGTRKTRKRKGAS